jgi:hypothetical protein
MNNLFESKNNEMNSNSTPCREVLNVGDILAECDNLNSNTILKYNQYIKLHEAINKWFIQLNKVNNIITPAQRNTILYIDGLFIKHNLRFIHELKKDEFNTLLMPLFNIKLIDDYENSSNRLVLQYIFQLIYKDMMNDLVNLI